MPLLQGKQRQINEIIDLPDVYGAYRVYWVKHSRLAISLLYKQVPPSRHDTPDRSEKISGEIPQIYHKLSNKIPPPILCFGVFLGCATDLALVFDEACVTYLYIYFRGCSRGDTVKFTEN